MKRIVSRLTDHRRTVHDLPRGGAALAGSASEGEQAAETRRRRDISKLYNSRIWL